MTDINRNLNEADRLAVEVDGLVDQLLDRVGQINALRDRARKVFRPDKPLDTARQWLSTDRLERMLQHRLRDLNLGHREPFKPEATTLAEYVKRLHDGVRRQLKD